MSLPTKERLAQVLHAHGLFRMEGAARAGKYDDFESESATPILDLVRDLEAAAVQARGDPRLAWMADGILKLAERARQGTWDGTKEEAEAWFEKDGKHLIPD